MGWTRTLRLASKHNWLEASREVLAIAAISLLPLLLRATFFWLRSRADNVPLGFWDSIESHVLNGNLLLFSISNFAAILWLASQDYKSRFSERIYFIIFCLFGLSISSFFLGFDGDFKGIPIDVLRPISITIFILSIAVNITLLVFRHYTGVDFQSAQSADEEKTLNDLKKRRQA